MPLCKGGGIDCTLSESFCVPLKIGILAGEPSGDKLGAGLIAAFRDSCPDTQFLGVTGPLMQASGCQSLATLDQLSVMGLWEILGKLPQLMSLRSQLKRQFQQQRIDLFIGIDSPDFNLPLAYALKQQGIPTVHYVSPSVWAWRQKRILKIARSVDLMLTLFPFEVPIYQQHHVPAVWVGHPLADDLADPPSRDQAKQLLDIPLEAMVLALLPGSRLSEVKQLAYDFLATFAWCYERVPYLVGVLPTVKPSIREYCYALWQSHFAHLPLKLIEGNASLAIGASHAVLVASGTATLETLFLRRPMVVAYRLSNITYRILKSLVTTPHFSLPNLLAERELVPEYIQHQVTPEILGMALLPWLQDPTTFSRTLEVPFANIHQQLRRDANKSAALAVLGLLKDMGKW